MQWQESGTEAIETDRIHPIRRAGRGERDYRAERCVHVYPGGIGVDFELGVGHGRVRVGHTLSIGVSHIHKLQKERK
jgi:hypothetical protein